MEATKELFKALERRGPNIIDELVECLKEEEKANEFLIQKIREGISCVHYNLHAYTSC